MSGFSALGTIFCFSTVITSGYPSTNMYVGSLTNISGPSLSAEEIDVSSHDSAGNYREYVSGFLDAGEFTFEGNLTTSTSTNFQVKDLYSAFSGRYKINGMVLFPIESRLSWKFHGYVTGVETNAPFEDKASFSATVRVSGGTTGTPVLSTSTST